MRMNEFISDKFVSFYFTQNFGTLLFKTEKFHPEIAIVNNIAWGDCSLENVKTMNKGYFETGLMLNGLMHASIIGYGLGFYYRYGPYAFKNEIDNFAAKLTLTISL